MLKKKMYFSLFAALAVMVLLASTTQALDIKTVPVGNAGNSANSLPLSEDDPADFGFGAVGYAYSIGKYEVTAGQYTEFLNAVAATDTYGLYNYMNVDQIFGCKIIESGRLGQLHLQRGSADWADRPVNYVSWGDAARFANWLHNGQPTGGAGRPPPRTARTTSTARRSNAELLAVTRKPDGKWVIPSEDEWYKAAYHKNDGVTGNYWDYPTSSNTLPDNAAIAAPVHGPPGRDLDPGNSATVRQLDDSTWTAGGCCWSGNLRTKVGDHDSLASPDRTFDQAGKRWDWFESPLPAGGNGNRVLRGGGYDHWDYETRYRYTGG